MLRAEIAGSGEPLWTAEDVLDVVDWAESSSLGIVAIEVYGKVELARGLFQRELKVAPPWGGNESWEQYVTRSAAQAREQLSLDTNGGGPADLYFLAVVPET